MAVALGANVYARVFDIAWRATALECLERSLTMTAHGHFNWNELVTRDAEKAKAFYRDTVGWTYEARPLEAGYTYWVAKMGDTPVAGFFPIDGRSEYDGVGDNWMPYLAVDNVDARVAKAVSAGATLMRPIMDIPDVGRLAILMEPGGAGIGWITPVK